MSPLLVVALALLVGRAAPQSDVECLKEFKSSVHTTGEYLQSWVFGNSGSNSSQPNICDFIGVQCLHPSEMKVYSLSLPGAGLQGSFPKGLEKCRSLTGLDLSGNAFTGPIPANICQMLPYLVKLDLSQNNVTGSIPEGLSSCIYLNQIRLQRNQLDGGIPGQIGLLSRLREFNVANNKLTGAIPYTFSAAAPNAHSAGFPASDFEGNEGLCGPPLQRECRPAGGGGSGGGTGATAAARRRTKTGAAVVAGVAVGGTVAMLAVSSICVWLMLERIRSLKAGSRGAGDDAALLDNSWLRRFNPVTVVVSMFEQPLVKLKLSDLAAATGGFSKEAVIGLGRTGVCYKASLRDGSILAVKRLRPTLGGGEKQFRSDMESLAKVRHRNLVPLLGYVAAGGERLLVYKHMAGGSLTDRLHDCGTSTTSTTVLDWPNRLKVAVGAARGLAWMHHSCNPRLVHRCLSSATILLDEDMEPRITDFGLARLLSGGGRSAMAPEERHYVAPEETTTFGSSTATSSSGTGSTTKGDVYAFGVVLLELVTGRRPSDGGGNGDSTAAGAATPARRSLVEWIGDLFKTGHVSDAIDPRLVAAEAAAVAAAAASLDGCISDNSSSGSGRRREVLQVLKIACSCVLSFPKERPSMYEVYHMLRGVGEDYYSCPRQPQQQQQQQQQQRLRQLDDDCDIAAASAALARNTADDEPQQGGVEMKRLDAVV